MALNLSKKSQGAKGGKNAKAPKQPPLSAFTPTTPVVNLLAADVQEIAVLRRLKRNFIVAAVALVAVAGAVWGGQQGLIIAAENSLDQATVENSGLSADKQALNPIAVFYAEVDANQASITEAMAKEVLYSQTLVALSNAAPAGVTIGNMALVVDTTTTPADPAAAPAAAGNSSGATCPGPDPFGATAAVGCVTVVGSATNREAVGELVNNLGNDDRFADAFITTTTIDEEGVVTFNATVAVTEKVYSGRYQDVNFLLEAGK